MVANAGIAVKDAATGALRSNLTDTAGIYIVVDLHTAAYETVALPTSMRLPTLASLRGESS